MGEVRRAEGGWIWAAVVALTVAGAEAATASGDNEGEEASV